MIISNLLIITTKVSFYTSIVLWFMFFFAIALIHSSEPPRTIREYLVPAISNTLAHVFCSGLQPDMLGFSLKNAFVALHSDLLMILGSAIVMCLFGIIFKEDNSMAVGVFIGFPTVIIYILLCIFRLLDFELIYVFKKLFFVFMFWTVVIGIPSIIIYIDNAVFWKRKRAERRKEAEEN